MDEERFAALEARMRAAEDQLEIARLLMAYGPLADSGAVQKAAELWTEQGIYDYRGGVSEFGTPDRLEGHDALKAMYAGSVHHELIHSGSGHVTLMPSITVHGETADATGYCILLRKAEEGWIVARASACHWTLKRTPKGWRIVERVNRLLDGSEAPRDLLRKMVPVT